MFSAHDVAAYIVERYGPMSALKLQKLLFYSEAWSLVWDQRPLFREEVKAWRAGAVVPAVYEAHRSRIQIASWTLGNSGRLDEEAKSTIESVVEFYGRLPAKILRDLNHWEAPWREARGSSQEAEPDITISRDAMASYYRRLCPDAAGKRPHIDPAFFADAQRLTADGPVSRDAWIRQARAKIAEYAELPVGWDGRQSPPLSDAARKRAAAIVPLIADVIPLPHLAPVPGGGMQFEWSCGERSLELEIRPDGSVVYLRSQPGSFEEQTLRADEVAHDLADWVSHGQSS
jgi:uncharacterized phage-associated protein